MANGKRMKKSIDIDAGTVSFEFPGLGEVLTLTMSELNEEIQTHLMYHGALQKCGDGGAVGKDASDEDCFAGVKTVIDQLIAGEWSTKRAAMDSDSKQAMAWLKKHAEDKHAEIMELSGDAKREAIAAWTAKYNAALAAEV